MSLVSGKGLKVSDFYAFSYLFQLSNANIGIKLMLGTHTQFKIHYLRMSSRKMNEINNYAIVFAISIVQFVQNWPMNHPYVRLLNLQTA